MRQAIVSSLIAASLLFSLFSYALSIQSFVAECAVPPFTVTITPVSATLDVGRYQPFTSIVVNGTPPYFYYWYLDGVEVPNVTGPMWTFAPTSSGIYSVYVNVTDRSGNVAKSNTGRVIVNLQPSVSITPVSNVMDIGQSQLITSSTVGGTPPFSYQWYMNGSQVPGATYPSWTFSPSSRASYVICLEVVDRLRVPAASPDAKISVSKTLCVTVSPALLEMFVGQLASFTSGVSGGTPPISYQWYLNESPVLGATSPSWTYAPYSMGSYTVYLNVTDGANATVKSNCVEANVTHCVAIATSSGTMDVGQSIVFNSTILGGNPPYTCQWTLNGNPVSGATSSSWTFTPSSAGLCMICLNATDNDGYGAKSNTATVCVFASPSVTISPENATMFDFQFQQFTSSITGGMGSYSYQWYLNGSIVPSATNATWIFVPISGGSYTVYVEVTDELGMQASSGIANVNVSGYTGQPIHDVAITNITSSSSTVVVGNDINANITLRNWGNFTETLSVIVYAETPKGDTWPVQTFAGVILAPGSTVTLSYQDSFTEGFYTLKAYVVPVVGENHLSDNAYRGPTFKVSPISAIARRNIFY